MHEDSISPLQLATLLKLASSIRDPDERQDALLALLEAQPTTEKKAQEIIDRCRYRGQYARYQDRQRHDPLPVEESSGDDWQGVYKGPIWDAAVQLPPMERNVILLHVISGMGFSEIAIRLGIHERAAYRAYHRAKNKVRNGVKKVTSQLLT